MQIIGKRRTRWFFLAFVAIATYVTATASIGQVNSSWPSKPLRIIVPYAPGGGTDIVARMIAVKLAESLGQPVIVDNRPGGRSAIAYEALLQDKADGHTLLLNNSSHNVQAAYTGLRYDPVADFVPITEIAVSCLVFVVPSSSTPRTLGEFFAWARQHPRDTAFGSFGVGTVSHLAGEILNGAEKIEMAHIAYKGSAPALNDALGGQVQALFVDPASAAGYVKAGRLRALAITGSHRWKAYADVPTFGELGYKDLATDGWWGVIAKRGIPPEVLARLAAELRKIVQSPDFGERVQMLGAEPFTSSPAEFERKIREDMGRWKRIVQERKIVLE